MSLDWMGGWDTEPGESFLAAIFTTPTDTASLQAATQMMDSLAAALDRGDLDAARAIMAEGMPVAIEPKEGHK